MAPIEKRVEVLNERFQPLVMDILGFAATAGYDLRIVETLRSLSQQAADLAAGSTTVRIGWHQYRLAFDFLLWEPGKGVIHDGADPRYRIVGEYAESLGCTWGGRFDIKPKVPGRQPDSGHIEYHPGFTLAQYQAVLKIQGRESLT